MNAVADFPRALTEAERSVLQLLLSIDFPGVSEYREQVPHATVADRCPCGCLEFSVEVADGGRAAANAPVLVSAWSEEQQVHLALETRDGRLAGVGLMWFGDDQFRLEPDLATFEVVVEYVA